MVSVQPAMHTLKLKIVNFLFRIKIQAKKSNKPATYPEKVKHSKLVVNFFVDTDSVPFSHSLVSTPFV